MDTKLEEMVGQPKFSTTLSALKDNLASTKRSRKQVFSIVVDSIVAVAALWAAYAIRFGEIFLDLTGTDYLFFVMPVFTVCIFAGLGVYRWVVRSSTQRLYIQLIKGSLLAALCLLVIMFLNPVNGPNPRSLFIIYGLLLASGTCGLRLLWQGLFDAGNRGMPIAIYGAGISGLQLESSLRGSDEYRPVCFIDDTASIHDSIVHGLPVYDGEASEELLLHKLEALEVAEIVIAIPSLSSVGYQKLLARLEGLGLPIRTLPSISELVSGRAKVTEIREISMKDILGRGEVPPIQELLGKRVTGKNVLVTGGGGSIGSELCRQIILQGPKCLTILDNSEPNLYHITEEINELLSQENMNPEDRLIPILGSVTDKSLLLRLFSRNKINTVYHAAAYKHVPIIEAQPEQGVVVNVFGTLKLVEAAIANDVEDFVLISTDKAVRPSNSMGASKRVAELILQAKAKTQNKTRISMVRFGNVLGSTGSVVPKFRKQIEAGGPVTLTHPDITRYFMTIPEASQLVLQASAVARGGDVFVLDMGEPMRIGELAETMIRLYNRRAEEAGQVVNKIDIVVSGLRPGEKMYEELFIGEQFNQTSVAKIFTAEEQWLQWKKLEVLLNSLNALLPNSNAVELKDALMNIVYDSEQKITNPSVIEILQKENNISNLIEIH
ncbi:MAG: nucleoside-diphosphate sugar epimerase/dehydratase [Granulosicoccus sp.]